MLCFPDGWHHQYVDDWLSVQRQDSVLVQRVERVAKEIERMRSEFGSGFCSCYWFWTVLQTLLHLQEWSGYEYLQGKALGLRVYPWVLVLKVRKMPGHSLFLSILWDWGLKSLASSHGTQSDPWTRSVCCLELHGQHHVCVHVCSSIEGNLISIVSVESVERAVGNASENSDDLGWKVLFLY